MAAPSNFARYTVCRVSITGGHTLASSAAHAPPLTCATSHLRGPRPPTVVVWVRVRRGTTGESDEIILVEGDLADALFDADEILVELLGEEDL